MRRRTNRQQRIDAFIKGFVRKYKKTKKKKRYLRDESLYNLYQQNEFPLFMKWMPLAAWCVASKHGNSNYSGVGSPCTYSLYDILVCLSIKRYFHLSLRRSKGLIEYLVRAEGLEVKVPSFRMLANYMKDILIRECFKELIEITSSPLKLIENCFSTDSSGVLTFCFSMWYVLRMGRKVRKRDHMMTHITSTTRLNAVTAVNVSVKKGKDNIYFRKHVKKTAKNFTIKEWSGDCSYLARKNCDAVVEIGGKPYFKLKENTTNRARGSRAWKEMVNECWDHPDEYDKHYHKRSNSESTFSAKKRKFGNFVRSKLDETKENEELFGWSCYNFGVLTRAYYEYGIVPDFVEQSE